MKRKELKNLAQKIAKCEIVIQTSDDPELVQKAELEVMELSGKVTRLEEIAIIDEMVQDILEKQS